MRIRVLYFAVVRERLARESEDIDIPEDASVADLVDELRDRHPVLAPLLPRLQIAVNQSVVAATHRLTTGDEVALLPPVSGGTQPAPSKTPAISVSAAPLSLDAVVDAVTSTGCGAVVTFSGVVRTHGRLAAVERLEYETYQPMAEAVLTAIAREIEAESAGVRVAIHHRTGTLAVGELAVVIAAAAPHRAEAFTACRAAIERLKERAPIWKKEVGPEGETWIGLGP